MAAPIPSVATFLVAYPQFGEATLSLVEQKLAEAAKRTSDQLWRDSDEQLIYVMLKAAVLLSKTPYARAARLVDEVQAMEWQVELYELGRAAGTGLRVF